MNSKIALMLVGCLLACGQVFAGNYTVTIDGKEHEFDLGKERVIKISDKQSIRITVKKKDIVTFSSPNFSFEHSSALSPSRTDLGDGIHQTMMASPLGTLVMLQEYSSMDPSDLIGMMVKELTKEEVNYGYKLVESKAEQKLKDGTKLVGKKVVTTYRDEEYVRYVLAYSVDDSGVMVITQADKSATPEDKQIIDGFWKTLKISMK